MFSEFEKGNIDKQISPYFEVKIRIGEVSGLPIIVVYNTLVKVCGDSPGSTLAYLPYNGELKWTVLLFRPTLTESELLRAGIKNHAESLMRELRTRIQKIQQNH